LQNNNPIFAQFQAIFAPPTRENDPYRGQVSAKKEPAASVGQQLAAGFSYVFMFR